LPEAMQRLTTSTRVPSTLALSPPAAAKYEIVPLKKNLSGNPNGTSARERCVPQDQTGDQHR
jgi:hypothetical protein